VRRRDLITMLGGALVVRPSTASAQQTGGMRRIAVLDGDPSNDPAVLRGWTVFRQALQALGWRQGENVQFDLRFGDGDSERTQRLAAEIVKVAPDVIVAFGAPAARALKARTHSIPIVFMRVVDPVGTGLVSSLTHPGGSMTGFAMYDFAVAGKWLPLLKEIAPRTKRVVLVFYAPSGTNAGLQGMLRSIEAAAKSTGIGTTELPIRSVNDIGRIAALGNQTDAGLIATPSDFTYAHRAEIARLVARLRLPAIYGINGLPAAGGLMSYDSQPYLARNNTFEVRQSVASYVDRILRGAKPSDLPVQTPTKYYLYINLKTAKALGLTVPQSLLMQADALIK